MRRITFLDVSVHQRFLYEGTWYIKVDPKVERLSKFKNAEDLSGAGFWFNNNDVVEVYD